MKTSSKTTTFLKECMADALLQAMKDQPFSKITINQITKEAGVNRSTWFRNFDTKSDALTFKLVMSWNRWASEHGLKQRHRYTVENVETFFEFNLSIRSILEVIYKADQQACVYNAFYQVMMPNSTDDISEKYQARFYSFGLFGLLDEWIKRECKETPHQLSLIFKKIMEENLQYEIFMEAKN